MGEMDKLPQSPMIQAVRNFTCEACGREFTTDTPIQDMCEEFKQVFGMNIEDCEDGIASVCDDCFEEIKDYDGE